MKTIHVHEFGDPEVMVLEEAADPTPAAGQILVDVKAAGVNPVDTTFRSGRASALQKPGPALDARHRRCGRRDSRRRGRERLLPRRQGYSARPQAARMPKRRS